MIENRQETTNRIWRAYEEQSTQLDLRGLNLRTSPSAIRFLTDLQSLDLSNNLLENISRSISRLSALTSLRISRNLLQALPDDLGKLRALKILEIDDNPELSELPQTLLNLSDLKKVSFSVTKIDSSWNDLPKLRERNKLLVSLRVEDPIQSLLREFSSVLAQWVNEAQGSTNEFVKRSHNAAVIYRILVELGSNLMLFDRHPQSMMKFLISLLQKKLELPQTPHLTLRSSAAVTAQSQSTCTLPLLRTLDIPFTRSSQPIDLMTTLVELSSLSDYKSLFKRGIFFGWRSSNIPQRLNKVSLLKSEVGALIAANRRRKERCLDLTHLGLRSLTTRIGTLAHLKVLDVGMNQLSILPESVCRLINLNRLLVSRNRLFCLPHEIGALKNLTCLEVDDNLLSSLPQSITQLTKLRVLTMDDNCLTALPDRFSHLAGLESISIKDNALLYLPESIGRLSALTYLNVCHNKLRCLPQELETLTQLVHLMACGNCIKVFPNIGNLTKLIRLSLGDNENTEIPDISRLTNLYDGPEQIFGSRPLIKEPIEFCFGKN